MFYIDTCIPTCIPEKINLQLAQSLVVKGDQLKPIVTRDAEVVENEVIINHKRTTYSLRACR